MLELGAVGLEVRVRVWIKDGIIGHSIWARESEQGREGRDGRRVKGLGRGPLTRLSPN